MGLEAKFLENRLGLQFTYYKSNSFNQLLQVSVPVATGFSSQYINAGNIQNQGFEVVVTGTPLREGALKWDIDFNLGMNRNKIVELTETTKQFTLAGGFGRSATPLIKEGGSYGDMEGFYWMKDANGNYLVTPDGKPLSSLTTGEYGYLGNFNPQATMGLTNTFNYNNFSLRLLIDGRIGGTVVDGTEMFLAFNGAPEVTSQLPRRRLGAGWKGN